MTQRSKYKESIKQYILALDITKFSVPRTKRKY